MDVQHKIRENNQELQEYLTDLQKWQQEIAQKDKQLAATKSSTKRDLPPIRNQTSKPNNVPIPDVSSSSSEKGKKIGAYDYKAWEKFDVEKALEETEKELFDNSSTKSTAKVQELPPKKAETTKQDELTTNRNKERSAEEKEKGNEFFKKGKFEDAIKCYSKSIELDPNNVLSLANRAQAYLNVKEYAKAEQDCTAAIQKDNTFVKAFARRGTARKGIGKYQEAYEDFQRMLDLEPNNKQAIEELAKLEKLRSSIETKPRKKITISEVSEMQPSEVEPPTKSSKTTSVLPKNERISPEPQKNVAESTGEKIPTTKVESKKVAQADAKKPATTPVRTFQIKLEVPKEPPKTSYEFETFWRNAKNDLSTFFEYFKNINPLSYAELFKASMSDEIFTNIISILEKYYIPNCPEAILPVLQNLVSIERFDMNVMFLSKKDKEDLRKLFDHISTLQQVSNTELANLKAKYGVK